MKNGLDFGLMFYNNKKFLSSFPAESSYVPKEKEVYNKIKMIPFFGICPKKKKCYFHNWEKGKKLLSSFFVDFHEIDMELFFHFFVVLKEIKFVWICFRNSCLIFRIFFKNRLIVEVSYQTRWQFLVFLARRQRILSSYFKIDI